MVEPQKQPCAASSPLLERELQEVIAYLTAPLASNGLQSGAIDGETFIAHVMQVAALLPDGQHAINLCENRYLFAVALCALVVRKQCSLLPSNKNVQKQTELGQRYDQLYLIHDGLVELAELASFDLSQVAFAAPEKAQHNPEIPLDHVAVISFTSGSTGEAKPNIKTWLTLRESTRINARYMLLNPRSTTYHLATVPGQHMWGLETSVLMALFAKVALVDARPLYPYDIVTTLAKLPRPRTLISTPLHIRTLNQGALERPAVDSMLVATAPLSRELASQVEANFNTELREVYGCTEAGSMALRRTAIDDTWQRFDGLSFEQIEQGQTRVTAGHLPCEVLLEDTIEPINDTHFRLRGRSSDQIKIAGKRGSLAEVNKALVAYPHLVDGVVFFPEQNRTVPRLVALVVLHPSGDQAELRAHLRDALDPAFVPRPILIVDSLPREDNGKLIKSKLLEFYQSLLQN